MREDWLFYGAMMTLVALWTADSVFDLHLLEPSAPAPVVERVVRFSEVRPIFQNRCAKCHSAPHWDWTDYDVAFAKKDRIKARVWVTRSMPMGTSMPEDERKLVRDWVDGGGER